MNTMGYWYNSLRQSNRRGDQKDLSSVLESTTIEVRTKGPHMSSIKEGDGIRPRSCFGKPEMRNGMRYGTLCKSARKREAETARQGHPMRVRENEAQGQNTGRSAHMSLRGKQGHQM